MRKVYVNVITRLIIEMEEGLEVGHVINDMDYQFFSTTEEADIIDSEIIDFQITDSK